jgi:hypothetical protein
MTTNLNGQQEAFAGFDDEVPTITDQIATFFSEPEPTHSAKNILLWKSYLPNDCVKSMITMGWDHST